MNHVTLPWSWASRRRDKPVWKIAKRSYFDCDYFSAREFLRSRLVKSDPCHPVFFLVILLDQIDRRAIIRYLGFSDERSALARPDPDNHRTTAANPPRLPGSRRSLDQHVSAKRGGEPNWRRSTLVATLANRGDIDQARFGKCIRISPRKLRLRYGRG